MIDDLQAIIHQSAFYEFSALLLLAALGGLISTFLRQPILVGFIAAGALAGPSVLGVMESETHIDLLSKLGIAVLLFMVGLKLDLKLIRTLGRVSLLTGLGQVFFTSVIGAIICLGLGYELIPSLYIAMAVTFSSTIIIIKLLSDKNEADSLHGRIALGCLIVQDLVVIIAMVVLSAMAARTSTIGTDGADPTLEIIKVVGSGFAMVMLTALVMRLAANKLTEKLARRPELLVCFAIAWAALLASMADYFGLSKELGGLLAGVALASTPYRETLISRMSSLRDFLLLFFFLALGAQLDLASAHTHILPAILISSFVLVGKPIIMIIIMGTLGYRKRTSFLAGVTLAQISEFSWIFMALGLSIGHISQDTSNLVTLVGVITISMSAYMITYSHTLYTLLEPLLSIFERKIIHPEDDEVALDQAQQYDVILFGLGKYGKAIAERLLANSKKILAVDFDPDVVKTWSDTRCKAVYGDAGDPEFLKMLPLRQTRWVVSALPQHGLNMLRENPRLSLLATLRQKKFAGQIAMSAFTEEESALLMREGADMVLLPYLDAAKEAVDRIMDSSAPLQRIPKD